MFASIPPRMILLYSPLASCRTRSLVCGPQTLCGLTTTGLAVFDIGLEAIQPVCAGVPEPGQIERSRSGEPVVLELAGLERPLNLPSVVGRVEVMGRDEDVISARLCRLEDSLHVLDGSVFGDARSHASQFAPVSLSTSFCGSMNTTAVSVFWKVMACVSAAPALRPEGAKWRR